MKKLPIEALKDGDNLLQSAFWGEFKQSFGWKPRAFRWTRTDSGRDESSSGAVLVLERRFPGGFTLAYVPYGPDVPCDSREDSAGNFLTSLAEELRPHLSKRCFMIRFDLAGGLSAPVGTEESRLFPKPLAKPLHASALRIQPQNTVILNLEDQTEDNLLAGMRRKTRYNIRLARRKGVEISRFQGAEAIGRLDRWYALYRETSLRDGISLHSESYYRRLFETARAENSGVELSLYMASHQDDILAGIIVARFGGLAVYMYGASGALKRQFMPNYLLQWEAVRDARREGALRYDFFGIPADDDPQDPMHGLWRFKTGFGGSIHHYRGAWDYAYSPLLYKSYGFLESFRSRAAARRKKRGR